MRRTLVLATAAVLAAAPVEAQHLPRQWLGAGIGVAVGLAFSVVYAVFHDQEDLGGCSEPACVGVATVTAGGALGYLIGNEFEKAYRQRYRHAPPLELGGTARSLAVPPTDLRLAASRVVVSGSGGVELFGLGPDLASQGLRARGLRGIGTADIDPATSALAVATGFGLYRFPLTGDAPGYLAVADEVSALAVGGPGAAVASVLTISLARFDGDSLRLTGEPVAEEARVMDLRWSGTGRLWAVTEGRVAVYQVRAGGETLELLGAAPLRTPGRSIAFAGDDRAVVATGSGGVVVFDARDLAGLAELTNWGGARFAYDVTTTRGRVYVAAGPEGLYVLELAGSELKPLGLVRDLGFVAGVDASEDGVFLIDRSGVLLRRLVPGAR